MTKSIAGISLLAGFLVAGRAAPAQEKAADLGRHRELKVLYAGVPGSDRERLFLEYLRAWFADVGSVDLRKLDTSAAAGYDVVVADWTRRYGDGSFSGQGPGPVLKPSFSRPIVMIGAVAGEIPRQRRTKIDWL